MDESVMPWKYRSGNNDTHRVIYEGNLLMKMKEPPESEKHMYCGKGHPLDYYSSSSGRVMVRFISDSQITAKGFKIQFSFATCNRNYTASSGRIMTNLMKENCTMTITTDPNTTISVYFSSISILKDYETGQCRNKLEFFEGTKKINKVCGWWSVPAPIFSESNSLTLKVTNVGMSSGFDLTYTSTDKARGCGGSFFNSNGAFTSPMYPGNYRNYSSCCWTVTVPAPGVPRFVFYEFDLGAVSTCGTDYVVIYDLDDGDMIQRTHYCGGDKPATFQGRTQSSTLCYKTSIHNSGIGWSVRWSTAKQVE